MFSRKRIVFLIAMVMVVAGALIAAFIMQLTNPPESTTSGPFTISSVSLARVGDEIVYRYGHGILRKEYLSVRGRTGISRLSMGGRPSPSSSPTTTLSAFT